ncbi:hypothetical protein [Halofilum ochraceum]|uniref:hypothetical protein n=1 Tax=Halofilum ochraceum TaxID=1611323 RepID=UPI0008D9ECA8|nr:hypothetical protein [Halofilum ochraceum]
MLYYVDEEGRLALTPRDLQCYLFADRDEVARSLHELGSVVREFVEHVDDFPDGPKAPSTVYFGQLYPVCLREETDGVAYPAHRVEVEYPEGNPSTLDWGLVRIGCNNFCLENDNAVAAGAIVSECIEREINPEDTAEALYGAARQIGRYARRF